MQHLLFQALFARLIFAPEAGSTKRVTQFMKAQEYNEMKSGPERIQAIKDLKHFLSGLIFSLLPLLACSVKAQTLGQLMAAEEYHHMKSGPEKTERVRQLENNGWYKPGDTYYDLKGKLMESHQVDLSPYIDDKGETVFLVTDLSPEFPGGQTVLGDYWLNVLGDNLLTRTGEAPQKQVRIKFTVEKDGRITEAEPAQVHPDWIPKEVLQMCLQSVQEMPTWLPGSYKDKPVKVKMLIQFSLRE